MSRRAQLIEVLRKVREFDPDNCEDPILWDANVDPTRHGVGSSTSPDFPPTPSPPADTYDTLCDDSALAPLPDASASILSATGGGMYMTPSPPPRSGTSRVVELATTARTSESSPKVCISARASPAAKHANCSITPAPSPGASGLPVVSTPRAKSGSGHVLLREGSSTAAGTAAAAAAALGRDRARTVGNATVESGVKMARKMRTRRHGGHDQLVSSLSVDGPESRSLDGSQRPVAAGCEASSQSPSASDPTRNEDVGKSATNTSSRKRTSGDGVRRSSQRTSAPGGMMSAHTPRVKRRSAGGSRRACRASSDSDEVIEETMEGGLVVPPSPVDRVLAELRDRPMDTIEWDIMNVDDTDCLGRGAFGSVWRGMLTEARFAGQLVAVKVSPIRTPDDVKSILREITHLRQHSHPNIVRFIGARPHGEEKGAVEIAMEFCGGGDIAKTLRKVRGHRFAENVVRQYTADITAGLAHLHSQNVIHRDVKPANVLVTDRSTLKLADFGISKTLQRDDSFATLAGTPRYMAPEVTKRVEGPAQDVWGLGLLVLEMATGQSPWSHLSIADGTALIVHLLTVAQDPVSFSYPVPDHLPADIRDFVQQCLRTDPKARPSTAELLKHKMLLDRQVDR
eukprot:TRINITY_DN733_c0_g1_i1.p1 TRINITY_DN733_c0_g1~~TRINITY_DN733_c0_g1_i1.p1  ORF type:complete len:627 (-),score=86.07 TRINITY_DN733_c0_g1_i1:242-2122(-)